MKFLTINNLGKSDIICSLEHSSGKLIWHGHKSNIQESILTQTLQYYYDKLNSRFLFIDYHKWATIYGKSYLQSWMTECFFYEKQQSLGLKKSYDTLLQLMNDEFGSFRKFNIIEL
jgi:hypothetical protein